MPFRVVVDASVVLAACLDPRMDAKAEAAQSVFDVLRDASVRPAITETLRSEVERKVHDRVGQVVGAVRTLQQEPLPSLDASPDALALLEPVFSKLRRVAEDSAGALQLLESRLTATLEDAPVTNREQWDALMTRLAIAATFELAEVQRRHDALNLEVLGPSGKANHERFRGIVPTSDLEHVAVIAAIAEARKFDIVFVTLDSLLHARRDEVTKVAPLLTVTTPAYLRRMVSRLQARV